MDGKRSLKKTLNLFSNHHRIIFYSSSFLFGMLGALVVFVTSNFFISPLANIPKIGTVNATALVGEFIKGERQKSLSDDYLRRDVRSFGTHLDKTLKTFAQQNHLILLLSEAVIAGTPDYTPLIKKRLMSTQELRDDEHDF